MKAWSREQKRAFDAGFSAADSRIPLRLCPHAGILGSTWRAGWRIAARHRPAKLQAVGLTGMPLESAQAHTL